MEKIKYKSIIINDVDLNLYEKNINLNTYDPIYNYKTVLQLRGLPYHPHITDFIIRGKDMHNVEFFKLLYGGDVYIRMPNENNLVKLQDILTTLLERTQPTEE